MRARGLGESSGLYNIRIFQCINLAKKNKNDSNYKNNSCSFFLWFRIMCTKIFHMKITISNYCISENMVQIFPYISKIRSCVYMYTPYMCTSLPACLRVLSEQCSIIQQVTTFSIR